MGIVLLTFLVIIVTAFQKQKTIIKKLNCVLKILLNQIISVKLKLAMMQLRVESPFSILITYVIHGYLDV